MAKETTTFELMLPIRDRVTPAYRWLCAALRAEILEGRLRPGARLPSTRDLALQYELSRGTIVTAFDELKAEGYIEGGVGSGTFVAKTLPDDLFQVSRTARRGPSPQKPSRRTLSDFGRRTTLIPVLETRPSTAFRTNMPAVNLFPQTLWAQITARRLRKASTSLLMSCSPMGYRPLQEAVADYVSTSRGVNCGPEQVAIVSGVQEALDLTARLFVNPGDRVGIEDPGYNGAALVFEAARARIALLPVDDEGMVVSETALRGARLVYITPAHQYPTGATMSLRRRLELLAWAHKEAALIFEDDYDSEYRYSGRPVPSLQGLDRAGQVLFAGSFNKSVFPSLRLGYMVVPADLIDRFAAAKSMISRHPPLLEQAVLCDFMTEGHFGRHLRRMREIYADRLSVLLGAAREKLAGLLEVSKVEAGLQTAGLLARGLTGDGASEAALARGVDVVSLSAFSRGRVAPEGLQMGFAAIDAKEIRRGVHELAIALESEAAASLRKPR
jgi:GntR family transcriptional regulator/MocR family aminotransferase